MVDIVQEIRRALREELVAAREQLEDFSRGQGDALRRQLDELALGQSSLISLVEQVKLEPATQSCRAPDDTGVPSVASKARISHCSALNVPAHSESEVSVQFARMYQIWGEHARRKTESIEKLKKASFWERLKMLENQTKELLLDGAVAAVVILNALFIGISADNWDGEINGYFLVDLAFTVVFLLELISKIHIYGIHGSFCDSSRKWANIFDLILVILDAVQLFLVFFFSDATDKMKDAGLPAASLFRVCRVLHVTRILRILRHEVFEELLAMFEAVLSGVRTLVWAIVLFVLVVYVFALLCRDALGNDPTNPEIFRYFSSVPRSFFTIFRCSFGDCTSREGKPIPESVNEQYGGLYSSFYCSCLFFISIGLFNIISAIFIDRTMARAAKMEAKHVKKRLMDEELWATRVSVLVRQCLIKMGYDSQLDMLQAETMPSIFPEIPVKVLQQVCVDDPQATAALVDLGIDEYDHSNIAHILDYDRSGSLGLNEIINGLHHMRGLPRRTDVITNCLLLEGVRDQTEEMWKMLKDISKSLYGKKGLTTQDNNCETTWNGADGEHDDVSSASSLDRVASDTNSMISI